MEQMNVNNPEDDERKEILIENGSVNSAEDVDGDETIQKGNINEAAESVVTPIHRLSPRMTYRLMLKPTPRPIRPGLMHHPMPRTTPKNPQET